VITIFIEIPCTTLFLKYMYQKKVHISEGLISEAQSDMHMTIQDAVVHSKTW
jgi:rRNA-processing protein FCF1